jgi:4,5-DOPA dioxygenase extradiol
MGTLSGLRTFAETLPVQSKRMPVLFTSHGNPFDIIRSRDERPFWNRLHILGQDLKKNYDVKAALVISAHWCTKGTFVNTQQEQKQIYDYYGFPDEYYTVKYQAKGSPVVAHAVHAVVPSVVETDDWGLDHGAWPMLMHLFPDADVPVLQMSIDYYAKPEYHYELGRQMKSLRDKGVLIIGSGSLIHNLPLTMQKFKARDLKPFGWEDEYDAWLKKQIDERNFKNLINYETSHKLGMLAAPTPDHYVPVLYSLGLTDPSDDISYFYDQKTTLPAFSERSFIVGRG